MGTFRLRVVGGGRGGTEIPFDGDFIVGRVEQGVGNLEDDPELSRRHARFYFAENGAALVEDLGSSNGTFVNDRRITGPRLLHPGDRVRVGTTTIELLGDTASQDVTHVGRKPERDAPPSAARRPPPIAKPADPAYTPPLPAQRQSRSGARWVGAVVALALIAGAAIAGYLIGHSNKSSSTKAVAQAAASEPGGLALAPDVQGVVYIESNVAQPDGNSVLAFQYRTRGDLHPMRIAEYPTGGAGSADLTDSGVLDADQHLWLDPQKHLLFAVNQGSDTIAVFHVHNDGSLQAVEGSPFPSGGTAPASVGVSGDTLIVANKAQDGVRDLKTVAPAYATFHIGPDGGLTPFGRVINAPPGNSPTDAMVGPDGKFVMSTEEGGPFRAFALGQSGLTQGSNSPLQPDSSIFPASLDASKRWGLGLSASPNHKLVYVGMATVNKIAVYRYGDAAKLTFVRAVDAPGAELPCWTLVNASGTRLYTANAGNNTMSVFDLTDPTTPKPLQTLHLHGDGNPWDIRFDASQKMIFLIDPRARTNVKPGDGQGLHTLLINPDGTLTEPSYSPITVPVGLNINPFGMAVLSRT